MYRKPRVVRLTPLLAVILAFALPLFAQESIPDVSAPGSGSGISEPARLRIGPTGIMCYMFPCPWRGVIRVDEAGVPIGRVLWYGEDLPPIDAPADLAERIVESWRSGDCLLIMGQISPKVLKVTAILGDC